MRQYVADASLAHRMHRDTISQAITLVGACFVKGETRHECLMAQWRYFDIRAAENSLSLIDCSTASLFAILRKEIQEFHKHVFGGDQFCFRNQMAGCDGALMPLVSAIEESHKVERVNEGVSRLLLRRSVEVMIKINRAVGGYVVPGVCG